MNFGFIGAALRNLLLTLLLFATVAPWGSPWCRFLEMPSGFRPQLAVLAGVLMLIHLATWRWGERRPQVQAGVVASATILVIHVALVAYCFVPRPNVMPTETQPLKLLTFNVLHDNVQKAETIAYARKQDPDLAVFLEATSKWPEALAVLKQSHPHHLPVQVTNFEIFSKHPIIDHKLHFYGDYRGFLTMTLDVHGSAVSVTAFHAYPTLYFGKRGFDLRNEQLMGFAEACTTIKKPHIALGDFNVDRWSPYFLNMLEASHMMDARDGAGVLASHSLKPNATSFYFIGRPIDTCLMSKDMRCEQIRTGPFLGSDHLPIVAEFAVSVKAE